jgi:hypothetical protein
VVSGAGAQLRAAHHNRRRLITIYTGAAANTKQRWRKRVHVQGVARRGAGGRSRLCRAASAAQPLPCGLCRAAPAARPPPRGPRRAAPACRELKEDRAAATGMCGARHRGRAARRPRGRPLSKNGAGNRRRSAWHARGARGWVGVLKRGVRLGACCAPRPCGARPGAASGSSSFDSRPPAQRSQGGAGAGLQYSVMGRGPGACEGESGSLRGCTEERGGSRRPGGAHAARGDRRPWQGGCARLQAATCRGPPQPLQKSGAGPAKGKGRERKQPGARTRGVRAPGAWACHAVLDVALEIAVMGAKNARASTLLAAPLRGSHHGQAPPVPCRAARPCATPTGATAPVAQWRRAAARTSPFAGGRRLGARGRPWWAGRRCRRCRRGSRPSQTPAAAGQPGSPDSPGGA